LWAWVRIPSFDATTDTTIDMYYGNADATDNQNETGTYPSSYLSVGHLNSLTTDSTGKLTYTNTGITSSTSKIGLGGESTGINDVINTTYNIDAFTELSIVGWVKSNDLTDNDVISGWGQDAGNGAVVLQEELNGYEFRIGDGSTDLTPFVSVNGRSMELVKCNYKGRGKCNIKCK